MGGISRRPIWNLRFTLAVAGILASALTAQAQSKSPAPTKELVAVLDLEGVGSSKTEVAALSERLREEMLRSGRITLIDRAQVNAIMDEQAFQQTGCTSQECAVQAGKILGVRELVTGKVIRIDPTSWLVSTTMINVETSETVRAESMQYRGDLFSLMDQPIAGLAVKLVGPPAANAPAPAPLPRVAVVAPIAPPRAAPAAQPGESPRTWGDGQLVRIALFPINVTGATIGQRMWWFGAINAATKRIQKTEIAYTWYPENTPGQPLTQDSNLPDQIRPNFFSKTPEFAVAIEKGRQLGVDAVLLINHMSGNPGHSDCWLVDVKTGHVSEQTIRYNMDAGSLKRIATQGVADLFQKSRDGM